jgi:hypothetical protein
MRTHELVHRSIQGLEDRDVSAENSFQPDTTPFANGLNINCNLAQHHLQPDATSFASRQQHGPSGDTFRPLNRHDTECTV